MHNLRSGTSRARASTALILATFALSLLATAAFGQCPAALPVQGGALPGPLPLFPPSNWWNLDISAAPVDAGSANYISFINNGGTRRLHPDFGGEESPGSVNIYGMPYAIVDGAQPKQAVTFQYWDESDGVNPATGQGVPFYPIPAQSITQPHWVEGGAPGNIDQRSQSDRHLLIVDCTNKFLYELYNVYYNASQAKWYAGSGAFFDMNTDNRRPDTWTSADAAGLAIFPGLVRYDEAWNPAVTDIGHAFRVTVRATNGYVYPASHRAGSTAGALPMGARLRLKTNVGGADPALRTADPNVRKIFRAMQKYGLMVADNGSDMYITGTFDTRWNNGVLNPAFATLSASDFDVIQLGWKPTGTAPALGSLGTNPTSVTGGQSATGTITLTAPAPSGGATVSLSSASSDIAIPATVSVAQGASTATFAIATSAVTATTSATISAVYNGTTRTSVLTVTPAPAPALGSLGTNPASVTGGQSATGTITLTAPAPSGGATVSLSSASSAIALPATVSVAQGASTATFAIATSAVTATTSATISAVYNGTTRTSVLTVTPAPALGSLGTNPASVTGGQSATGTITLTAPAPSGGATVSLSSANSAIALPATVSVAQGASTATFAIATSAVTATTSATISAVYNGTTKTSVLKVTPAPALWNLTLNRNGIRGGLSFLATVQLTKPAPSGGTTVALTSSNPSLVVPPANVVVPAGATKTTVTVTTSPTQQMTWVTISASYAGVTKSARINVTVK